MLSEKLREDFPIIQKYKDVIYLDNACTTLKPQVVIDAVKAYYEEYGGCAGRSAHRLSRLVDEKIVEGRKRIADFLGAKAENIVYTKNCSEAINLVAKSFDFSKRKKVVGTILEHHSSMLPFEIKALRKEIELVYAKPLPDGTFDVEQYKELIDRDTALVAVHHTNNTLGTKNPVREIAKIAHENGAQILVDAAQGVPHSEIKFQDMDADYLTFSGHKMLGPTGIGALVAKAERLEEMPPFLVGGDTIEQVKTDSIVWAKPPRKFEAGIQHYSGIIGLGAAAEYLKKIGMRNIEEHEKELGKVAFELLSSEQKLKIYGPREAGKRTGIFTFNVRGITPHQVAMMLDKMKGIAVRSGVFCAQPGMDFMGACDGAVRASFYLYNTKTEIEVFADTLKKVVQIA
ncbi:cysteine desulfurase [Candidatus Micrarchaeota archaeon]|nr:cysteine desulfurase [Candidatus Micrarchaeota archaeon]